MRCCLVRNIAVFLLIPAFAARAQDAAPIGIIRCDLLSWSGTRANGELVFRRPDNHVFQCHFDERTYFEQAKERIAVTSFTPGEHLELLTDHKPGSSACYVRTAQVIDSLLPRTPPRATPQPKPLMSSADLMALRGNLTVAGVVLQIADGVLVLRTRSNEQKRILLRPDTRYFGEGQPLTVSGLPLSTRVFIRAGRSLEGNVEAYQIVWGSILEPVLPPRTWN